MYAIVETGGKQYRVAENTILDVEKIDLPTGEEVALDRVLLVSGEAGVTVGTPVVAGVRVICKVLGQDKTRKLLVFHYKPKKNQRRRYGHRQAYSRLRVERIEMAAGASPSGD